MKKSITERVANLDKVWDFQHFIIKIVPDVAEDGIEAYESQTEDERVLNHTLMNLIFEARRELNNDQA